MSGRPTPPLELVFVRHAQSEWNARGVWQGQADPPLSPLGREQAAALAERLGHLEMDRVVSSDLLRAQQTAAPWAERVGCRLELRRELRELDAGTWSGRSRSEIRALEPALLAAFDAGELTARAGGGESRAELHARAYAAIRVLVEAPRTGPARIGIVSHFGWIRSLQPQAQLGNAEHLVVAASEVLAAAGARAELASDQAL